MNPHISTLKLHQLRLGELPDGLAETLQEHLADCALCQARSGHQAANRAAFEAMPEPLALSPVLHPRKERPLRMWPILAAILPLAAAMLLMVRMASGPLLGPDSTEPHAEAATQQPPPLVGNPSTETQDSPAVGPPPSPASQSPKPAVPKKDHTRTKGVALPRLEAWVQAGDSARPLYTGESLGAGTKVQLRYDALGKRYITLAGRDSNGVVEIYATLATGDSGLTNAPFALTLDDSKGEQVFFAIATDLRPDTLALQAVLGHNPVRMDGAVITSLVLRKD